MIALGAHYLPFVFLYGMRLFWALAAILAGGGVTLGLYAQESFALGAWCTGIVLLAFSVLGQRSVEQEERVSAAVMVDAAQGEAR